MSQVQAFHILERFSATISAWRNAVAGYSYEAICLKPSESSWSLGQLINHIILDTRFHIDQMSIALTDQQNANLPMHAEGIDMLGKNSFPDILIEGAPGNASIQQPSSLSELIDALQSLQTEVESLVHTFDFMASKGKSQHPGLGYFTALQWLQFTEMHMRHHFRQKSRIDIYIFDKSVSN